MFSFENIQNQQPRDLIPNRMQMNMPLVTATMASSTVWLEYSELKLFITSTSVFLLHGFDLGKRKSMSLYFWCCKLE